MFYQSLSEEELLEKINWQNLPSSYQVFIALKGKGTLSTLVKLTDMYLAVKKSSFLNAETSHLLGTIAVLAQKYDHPLPGEIRNDIIRHNRSRIEE